MSDSGLFGGDERKDKEQQMVREGRLPPGQSLTLKWPVLHYGSVPQFDPAKWDFRIWGLVEQPARLTWKEFNKLPRIKDASDFQHVQLPAGDYFVLVLADGNALKSTVKRA